MAIECTECPEHAAICCPDCGKDYYLRDASAQAEIDRLTAERDARDRAKVAEGLRMAAKIYEDGGGPGIGGWDYFGDFFDAILSRAKDMEAGNG